MFKSRLTVSLLHCRNNHIGSTKLIPEKKDQERKQRENKDRNQKLGNEISFEGCIFEEIEKPTGMKPNREFKKGEHRNRKLGSILMEKLKQLISF